ncbi:MAG: hypothetical protein ACR2IV_10325, partial [Bryobacteraceae bacterium]
MPIKLPDLSRTGALRLVACGHVEETTASLNEWLAQPRNLVCAYSVGGRRYYSRLMTGPPKRHFHLEILSADVASNPPKSLLVTRKQLNDATDKVLGQEINVTTRCFFVTRPESLSPTAVIRTLLEERTAAGVSMKLTSGTLALKGSP